MTTIDKFRDAVSNHFARSRKLVWTVFAAGLLLFSTAWLAVQFVVTEGFTQYYAFTGLIFGLGAITFLVTSLGTWCKVRRPCSDPRLVCAQCGRPVQMYCGLVIATGDCPQCGWRILGDRGYGKKPQWPDAER
jgi:hypothetical protein